jgi:hypothetical protein
MLTRWELDRVIAGQALKTGAPTPGHAAAEGAVDGQDPDEAERRRLRVQHAADPYTEPAELPAVDCAELGKRYNQAYDTPDGYPQPGRVDPEEFRRAPLAAGRAAYGTAYQEPGRAVPVPSTAMSPGTAVRPLLADGRARPCGAGGC